MNSHNYESLYQTQIFKTIFSIKNEQVIIIIAISYFIVVFKFLVIMKSLGFQIFIVLNFV